MFSINLGVLPPSTCWVYRLCFCYLTSFGLPSLPANQGLHQQRKAAKTAGEVFSQNIHRSSPPSLLLSSALACVCVCVCGSCPPHFIRRCRCHTARYTGSLFARTPPPCLKYGNNSSINSSSWTDFGCPCQDIHVRQLAWNSGTAIPRRSHHIPPLYEVERRRARLVPRWGTTWEALVLFLSGLKDLHVVNLATTFYLS